MKNNGIKVCKFGGTSMASADSIKRVAKIINNDRDRRYVVVSAPGKRFFGDEKITDLLIKCSKQLHQTGALSNAFNTIKQRFKDIARGLMPSFNIDEVLKSQEEGILNNPYDDYIISRGEYLSGVILAAYLGIPFVDSKDVIVFDSDGTFDFKSSLAKSKETLLKHPRAVISGFYGADNNGRIWTFSRGGSDVSGAVLARAVDACVYENFTDVDGVFSADPRIVDGAKVIPAMSYGDLRKLSYYGAGVLHESSVFAVRDAGIPINVRNTFNEADGTVISSGADVKPVGVAGRQGLSLITVKSRQSGNALNAVYKKLLECNACVEQVFLGADEAMVIARNAAPCFSLATGGYDLKVTDGVSLVTAVGADKVTELNLDVFAAAYNGNDYTVCVKDADFKGAMNALYAAYFAENQ